MDFEGGRDDGRDYEREIFYDSDTLQGVLDEIDTIALNHDLPALTRSSDAYTPQSVEDLSGKELGDAIADLSAATIRDIREFERHEGFKDGLQAVAIRIGQLITGIRE